MLYFSKAECKEVGILPRCFPMPTDQCMLQAAQTVDALCANDHAIVTPQGKVQ